ncbi:MAG TPA: alpha/beta hydrolase [Anaerolineales bacterium]|nr:alpha/beta hydrolase [Anaerolineales bacterium]
MKSFDVGGAGPPLHFLHANGYPPDCYTPLLELLKTEYQTHGMLLRPLWDDAEPEEIQSWHPFSDDLLRFLSDRESFDLSQDKSDSVIGVGHSIGAVVTLRAALRDPGKFRALVLIDPVLFIPPILLMWKITHAVGLGDRIHPLIIGAKKRRRTFDNLETVFRGYRNRNVFRYMSDASLQAYIEGITKPSANGGYELTFSPEWEVQIYRTAMQDFDIWNGLPKLEIPTLIIRGKETDTFLESAAKLVKRKQPKVKVETLEKSTHLLPLERPKKVFDIMQLFLQEVL